MIGRAPRPVRPMVLLVVYGAFLVVVGVTATVQTTLVSLHFSTATVNTAVAGDAAIVRAFVNDGLSAADLTDRADPARVARLEGLLGALARYAEMTRVEVRDPGGVVRLSTDPSGRDAANAPDDMFARALAGTPDAAVLEQAETGGPGPELRMSFPLLDEAGEPHAVVSVWRPAEPFLAPMTELQRDMLVVTISAALVAGAVLYLVFRAAQERIRRQTQQLLESTERDPLTGLLNHGALVGELALALEVARGEQGAIGVALVDIDNFRLLNETQGHDAGDTVLRLIADALRTTFDKDVLVGRYGPDEFLVIARAASIVAVEPGLERLREVLLDESLDVNSTERLPITVSAGLAVFPDDADSITALLSTVALALGEAKAGGGDAIRRAGRAEDESTESRAFNVLQSLIFAIDTKDRYTKRHSEDVARYAVFLAGQIGLDPLLIETIRTAGLLHDVGKIGIPDAVLRKPGKLTAEEYDVVQQHVALGESIVGALVDDDIVRIGIRHHHERWDGTGYLHRLAGEEIPLVARILAVGDAFSAMTTTRPYRKALSVEEALRRLGDAAGSQLEERLVVAFIAGLEHAPDAPLPDTMTGIPLWVPAHRVA